MLAEASRPIQPPRPGTPGPDDKALRDFARTYRTELARWCRGAR